MGKGDDNEMKNREGCGLKIGWRQVEESFKMRNC